MSLTPEEIAMCRDALLEAGVPQRIVAELVEIRDRIREVHCVQHVDDMYAELHPGVIVYVKDKMCMELAKMLIGDGVARISERRDQSLQAITLRLSLSVLTPPGWKPPAKEPR